MTLSVVDFRLAVESAVRGEDSLTLEQWIPERRVYLRDG